MSESIRFNDGHIADLVLSRKYLHPSLRGPAVEILDSQTGATVEERTPMTAGRLAGGIVPLLLPLELHGHLPCGMKPGLPVFTTSLNLCLV